MSTSVPARKHPPPLGGAATSGRVGARVQLHAVSGPTAGGGGATGVHGGDDRDGVQLLSPCQQTNVPPDTAAPAASAAGKWVLGACTASRAT